MSFWKGLWRYRSTLVFIVSPVILLPLPFLVSGKEALCGYCMALMAIYWMTEVLPLAVTSLIPLVLFPLLGIMKAADVSQAYLSDTVWLLTGGLMIAVSVETTNLHKRISLRVLTLLGSKPRCLMLGFMITTFFLSMWISNTATTGMMLPIVEAVTNELIGEKTNETQNEKKSKTREILEILEIEEDDITKGTSFSNKVFVVDIDVSNGSEPCSAHERVVIAKESHKLEEELRKKIEKSNANLRKGLILCVPYAAGIGGTATVTGTGPNLVLSGLYAQLFPEADIQLSFATWLAYCLPGALVFFIIAYLWISCFYLGFNVRDMFSCLRSSSEEERKANEVLKRQYRNLGPISWAEVTSLVIFMLTALLWFFRNPGFIPGWSVLFEDDFVKDGTVAVAMGSLLFFLPSRKPELLIKSKWSTCTSAPAVINWGDMQKLFPWSVVLLAGGGFALAQGATDSGLSQWLGDQLKVLQGIDTWLISLIITIIVCAFTEFASNAAIATLFVPILATLAQSLEVHPIHFLIPPILAASMAFMFPVATAPNAMAFAYGHLNVLDMIKVGTLLNIIGIGVVTLFINTYGYSFFGLGTFPDWAIPPNTTDPFL